MNPNAPGIEMDNIVFAENLVSVVLRHAQDDADNPNTFTNWYVTALARPNCT